MNPVTVPSFALPAKGNNAGPNLPAKNDKASFGDTLRSTQERPRNADQRAERNEQPLARLVAKLAEALEQAETNAPAAEPKLEVAPKDTKDEDVSADTTDPEAEDDDTGLVPVVPVSFAPPATAPAQSEPTSKTMPSQQADTAEQGEQRAEATASETDADALETRPATIDLRANTDTDTAQPAIAAAAQTGSFVSGARVAEIVQTPQSARSRALNEIASIFNGQLQQAAWPAAKEEQAPPSASADSNEPTTTAAPPATSTIEAEAPAPAEPSARPLNSADQKPQANTQTREQPRDPFEASEPNKADGIAAKAPGSTAVPLAPNATVASVVDALAKDSATAQSAASASAPQAAAHTPGAPQPHTLKIQLNPIELGMVTATLRMSGDQMTVELTTEKMEAYERLSVDSDTIVKSLRGLGIQVDQLTVQPPQVTATGAARPEGTSAQTFSGGQQQSAQTGNMGGGERNGRSGGSDQGGFQNGSNATGDAAPFAEDRARRGLVI